HQALLPGMRALGWRRTACLRRGGPLALVSLPAAEPFEFARRPIHRLLARFPLLGALRDHLRQGCLRVHLVRDLRRRLAVGDDHLHIAARRVLVNRALGRLLDRPSLEIVQLRELRDVVTMARRNRLLDRGALAQMRQKRLRRRDVLRKTPNAPEERHCRIEAAFWSLWRGEGPELLGAWPRIAHRDGPC